MPDTESIPRPGIRKGWLALYRNRLITVMLIAWALFQLSLPQFLIIDTIKVRCIHLAFALPLGFLAFPFLKKKYSWRIFIADFILAAIGAAILIYTMIHWVELEGLAVLSTFDCLAGTVLVILLLEASRRVLGPALSILAIIFSVYVFFAEYAPGVFAMNNVSLNKYLSKIVFSSEGIFGIPIDVSANTVFLFVLFGGMMNKIGAGTFFNDLAISLLGRLKGGPAKAAVVSSGFTGLVSGSSIANVVTTGTFTIPLMKKVGYPPETAAATEVAASTNGQLMPPIMGAAAFIIAEYVGIPYIDVVKAALIPAVVSYIALFYIAHLEADKLKMKGLPPEEVPKFFKVLKHGFYFLIPLAVLVFELLYLRHSPKLAAYRGIIALAVVFFIRELIVAKRQKRSMFKTLGKSVAATANGVRQGAGNMIPVAVATATAGIIVGVVTLGVGDTIASAVEVLSCGNFFLLLVITAIASLILGMGLPTTATYIVMATITVGIITQFGAGAGIAVVPVIAAHLFCFYFGILADDTPPVGLAAYTAAAIAKSNPIKTGIKGFMYDLRTAVIPFMFILNPAMLLVGVKSVWMGLAVFAGATFGALAFTNAVQGRCVVRNRWYEIPFFLFASWLLFAPNSFGDLTGIPGNYYCIIMLGGLLVYAAVFYYQKFRSLDSKIVTA